MPQQPPSASNPLFRLAFYGIAIVLALAHVFITFKGLHSAEGMEQAQIARELARGHGLQTKVIRPHSWALLEEAGKQPSPMAMAEISQPPIQPFLLAPVFKLLETHLDYRPGKDGAIYLLDRVVACIGVVGLLLTLLWTHGAARLLFDEKVAGITVLAVLVCQPLWDLAVSGSSVALLMPMTALAVRLLVSASLAAHEKQNCLLQALLLGGVLAVMALTHWLAVWLVLGLLLAGFCAAPGRRKILAIAGVFPALALILWGVWMMKQCGDPLGGAKTLFQSHLISADASMLDRQFSLNMPAVQVTELLRKLAGNWQVQLGSLYAHLGYSVLPVLFFVALLHRFKRPEASAVCLGLSMLALSVMLAMGFAGMPADSVEDSQFYLLLIPPLSVYGAAMAAILWARFFPAGNSLWTQHGFVILVVGITALPMINSLPAQIKTGMTLRGRVYPHWPPYVPDRVSVVRKLVEPDEMLFSDAPWFVAWYADVPTAWVPGQRSDYDLMKAKAAAANTRIAGFVMTPISARVEHLHEAFTGPYQEWPDLLFRGLMLAFDREFPARPDFEFKVPLPLVAVPVGPKESLSLQMTFYTDRARAVKE
ncbi:MAG TPA: hypothetical protein VGE29_12415 [Prosthecobacter sp.]